MFIFSFYLHDIPICNSLNPAFSREIHHFQTRKFGSDSKSSSAVWRKSVSAWSHWAAFAHPLMAALKMMRSSVAALRHLGMAEKKLETNWPSTVQKPQIMWYDTCMNMIVDEVSQDHIFLYTFSCSQGCSTVPVVLWTTSLYIGFPTDFCVLNIGTGSRLRFCDMASKCNMSCHSSAFPQALMVPLKLNILGTMSLPKGQHLGCVRAQTILWYFVYLCLSMFSSWPNPGDKDPPWTGMNTSACVINPCVSVSHIRS
jgi:hypothetical protein